MVEKTKINTYQNLDPISSATLKKDGEKHEKTKLHDEIIEKKSPKKVDQSKTVIFDAISNGDLEKRSSVFDATPLGSGISLMVRRRKTNTLRFFYRL